MDVKAPLGRYRQVTRSEVAEDDIVRSIDLLRGAGCAICSGRRSCPAGGERDLLEIAQLLHGADLFQVQQFSPRNTVDRIPPGAALSSGRGRAAGRAGPSVFQESPGDGGLSVHLKSGR